MTVTKILEVIIPEGKSAYTSETLTNKLTELKNSGDLLSTSRETLSAGHIKTTRVFKNNEIYENFLSWLDSSGEKERAQQYDDTNGIRVIVRN